jgi:hypothetical protein
VSSSTAAVSAGRRLTAREVQPEARPWAAGSGGPEAARGERPAAGGCT